MKNLIILFFLGAFPMALGAQDTGQVPDNDQIRAQRGAYITQRLRLNSQEAAHFWTSFNDYEERKAILTRTFKNSHGRPTTEVEADEIILRRFEMEEDLLAMKRAFYLELKTKIPAQKLFMLPQAESEFRRDLLRQLRQRRQQRGGGE